MKDLAFAHLNSDFKVPSSLYRAPNSLRVPAQEMVENKGNSGGGPERKQVHSYSRVGCNTMSHRSQTSSLTRNGQKQ